MLCGDGVCWREKIYENENWGDISKMYGGLSCSKSSEIFID